MKLSQAAAPRPTGLLALADGTVFEGVGLGAVGETVGEVCFNTAITGYQEILTDPSYAAQIVTFTFPHIGNVGANEEDVENASPAAATAARGAVFRADVTSPSNYRARLDLGAWLKRRGIIGLSGIDTRALTRLIREKGMPHGVIAHSPVGEFDRAALTARAAQWGGLEGRDLAKDLTAAAPFKPKENAWEWDKGYGAPPATGPHVVVIDYGIKANILRNLAAAGCRASVVPALTPADEILALKPDGVLLSNGPGDPAATAEHSAPVIRQLIDAGLPVFGICLGHQMLALALGAKTKKMPQGHHGANHPVKDLATGKVEIVSMNHGFTVDRDTLPDGVEETHVSLFDGTNCGIALKDKPVSSVQYHPEASPGPQDSFYLFERFVSSLKAAA
ncbi:MAG: glutamine-hydrolyzing carbamoyl-phosphate synthase small subunit [Pseudomonadota bacterium]